MKWTSSVSPPSFVSSDLCFGPILDSPDEEDTFKQPNKVPQIIKHSCGLACSYMKEQLKGGLREVSSSGCGGLHFSASSCVPDAGHDDLLL